MYDFNYIPGQGLQVKIIEKELKEPDPDLEEKRGGFRGVSRRNDAWDLNELDYLQGLMMSSNITDIRAVQSQRSDLSDSQAEEVLVFLNDAYAVESYEISDNQKLFKETASYIFPEVQS